VAVLSPAYTFRAKRLIRLTRVPACSVMSLAAYQERLFKKIPASSSDPARTFDSMIRL
jgi:hypothetical protein